ncbi:MAG: phosphopantetheine-binding protein [Oscillospiraceae bacterium]|jgi:acyl carrier protein|nr:phosphopantetheine-binding protein [Oscillospiraceae bacterium]
MLEKIVQMIRNYKGDEGLVVTENSSFEELELDSLDTVELVMKIEEEFSVSIEMDAGIKSVGDIIRIIESEK